MIIIKIIILYLNFIQIRHTDDFPSTGTWLVHGSKYVIDRVDEPYARVKQNEKFPVRWSYNLPVRINISISVRVVEQANEADRAKSQSRTSFY